MKRGDQTNLFFIGKKIIIFDMDETLVHCVNDPYTDDPDIVLTINFPEEPEPVEVSAFFYFIIKHFRQGLICVLISLSAWRKPINCFKLVCSLPHINLMQMLS